MMSGKQLEILDIRHYSARQLRPLLESEAVAWEKRLRWDYRSSTELLLQYLDSHILPGFVALEGGKICGFTFCVYEGNKAVVGDAYAVGVMGNSAIEITRVLLIHLLEVLLHAPNISRVESQLLLYDEGTTATVFHEHGFAVHPRLFMECDLRRTGRIEPRKVPHGMRLIPWAASYYQAAAELIHEAYQGNIDSRINDQYRTLHGSLRFLHNIVRFPGCGVFEENASWLLLDEAGKLIGVILCSRVAERVAHITQLCVAQRYRGQGLAGMLLRHVMRHHASVGFEAMTLTVTEANNAAVGLYEAQGFVTEHRFDAMVLDKQSTFTL